MRQNFVIKLHKGKTNEIVRTIMYAFSTIIFLIGFFILATGDVSGIVLMIFGGIIFTVGVILYYTVNKQYHGYFSMDGFSIDCRTTKFSYSKGFSWDIRVNDIPLPVSSSPDKFNKTYSCVINGTHTLQISVNSDWFTYNLVYATLGEKTIIEDGMVYVDRIKDILNQ